MSFTNNNFLQISFAGSVFKDVEFINCNFNQVTFEGA